jgi:hypothetical protein
LCFNSNLSLSFWGGDFGAMDPTKEEFAASWCTRYHWFLKREGKNWGRGLPQTLGIDGLKTRED